VAELYYILKTADHHILIRKWEHNQISFL